MRRHLPCLLLLSLAAFHAGLVGGPASVGNLQFLLCAVFACFVSWLDLPRLR